MKTKISRKVGHLTIPFLIFCVLATISIGVVQAASVSIEPASNSVNKSDTFSVNVTVDPAGQAVMGAQIKLNFDKSVVNLNSVVIGPFLGSSPVQFANKIDNANGTLELSYTIAGDDSAKSTKGTFATLTFVVKSDAPDGTSNLDLTMAKLSNATADPIAGVTINDGTITVSSAPGNGGGGITSPTVQIEPSSKSVNRADTFSVNVVVYPAGQAVSGVQIKMNFDESVVNLNSAVPGPFLGSSPVQFANKIDNANGTLELGYTIAGGDSAKSANGTFATLTFTVKSNAPNGTSNLDLTMAKLSNGTADPIAGVTMNDGQVNVSGTPQLMWKFISVPYLLNNSSADYVLRGLVKGTDYTELYAWDSAGKKWVSPVTEFMPLHGYLIKIDVSKPMASLEEKTGPHALPSLEMNMGWNLVGTSGTSAMSAEIMLDSIVESYHSIVNWNVAIQDYDTVGVNSVKIPAGQVGTDAFMMQPGIGYWVSAKKNAELFPIDT